MDGDTQLFLIVNQALSGPWATALSCAITWLGNGIVLAALILPLMYILDRKRFREHALALVLAVAVSGLVVNVTKVVVDRPRPAERLEARGIEVLTPMGTPPDRSFPSGHAQTSMGAAVYLSCLYPALSVPLVALACLVGVSRVALGVHTPLEVLAGAAIGALLSLAGYALNARRLGRGARTR